MYGCIGLLNDCMGRCVCGCIGRYYSCIGPNPVRQHRPSFGLLEPSFVAATSSMCGCIDRLLLCDCMGRLIYCVRLHGPILVCDCLGRLYCATAWVDCFLCATAWADFIVDCLGRLFSVCDCMGRLYCVRLHRPTLLHYVRQHGPTLLRATAWADFINLLRGLH